MVSHPVHVSVYPSPALGLGWFGHRSVAPPAAPVCWALPVSLLRRSVALAFGRTLFLLLCLAGLLPLVFVGLGLVGCGPAWVPAFFWWGTLLPLSWLFSLGGSYCVVVWAPCVFLELFPGVLPLAFSFLLIARGGCG